MIGGTVETSASFEARYAPLSYPTGALLMKPDEILAWGSAFREGRAGEFQINLWIAEAPPVRDFDLVAN
jgi:hypothetical protein